MCIRLRGSDNQYLLYWFIFCLAMLKTKLIPEHRIIMWDIVRHNRPTTMQPTTLYHLSMQDNIFSFKEAFLTKTNTLFSLVTHFQHAAVPVRRIHVPRCTSSSQCGRSLVPCIRGCVGCSRRGHFWPTCCPPQLLFMDDPRRYIGP